LPTALYSLRLSGGRAVFRLCRISDERQGSPILNRSDGWEIGVGPTVVVVDEGAAKNLSPSMLKDDAYAFIFDQKGG